MYKFKSITVTASCLLVTALLTSCEKSEEPESKEPKVTSGTKDPHLAEKVELATEEVLAPTITKKEQILKESAEVLEEESTTLEDKQKPSETGDESKKEVKLDETNEKNSAEG
ncbi:MAG: hypothetical protein LBS14_00450 [Holosporaceae bacterium]|jgi:hypothetical protein|nr:hypothetical protein [Holosporaceae bacterium]